MTHRVTFLLALGFARAEYSIAMTGEHAARLLAIVPPPARAIRSANETTIDVDIWTATGPTFRETPLPPLTWEQFARSLRAVRDCGPVDIDALRTLFKLGYVHGSQSDPAGVLLTTRGRTILESIERDSAELDRALQSLAGAMFPEARP